MMSLDSGGRLREEGPRIGTQPESAPYIVVYDADCVRAARISTVLGPSLLVVHKSRLEPVPRVNGTEPVAVLCALDWSSATADTELLQFIRAHRQRFAIVVYADTTHIPIGVYCRPLCAGAARVFNEASPTFTDDVSRWVWQHVHEQQKRLEEEIALAGTFEALNLIGQSAAMREVFRRAVRAGHFSDLPVLILGETGTGKQRVAEAIHRLDLKRKDKRFLTINCAAISKSLAESELFGHVRGAFSGADSARGGLFRAAEGGTLFLDEIAELDLELQPKLLRVLQDQRLLPVGADYEHAVNVRVIAATNRNLESMVADGKFRDDLYQRLNVFRIRIPALRERPEDIELQARYFLRLYGAQAGASLADFASLVLDALRTLPWEGNTRQLENLIREILTFKEAGPRIELEDLPLWVLERLAGAVPQAAEATDLSKDGVSLSRAIADYERGLLQSLLVKNRGNRTRTAAELGLTPRTLYNKLKKHGLGSGDGDQASGVDR